MTLTSSLNPSTYGQAVTFTATVSASSGPAPMGTVKFKHGGLLGTATVNNGVATFTTSALQVGAAEVITAVYTGNATTAGSTATVQQTVLKNPTTTTLTSNLNPADVGQAVTFTGTVTAASGPTPTGMVSFKNGGTLLGTATLVNGTAKFVTAGLPAGSPDHITATYNGNSSDVASTSAALAQTVH